MKSTEYFPRQILHEGGVSTFGDVPAILGKSEESLAHLRQTGLRRVYVGMESGSDGIRALINKPGLKSDVMRALEKLKRPTFESDSS